MTTTRTINARWIALGAVVALAATATLVGPLAQRASAASYSDVDTEAEYRAALDDINTTTCSGDGTGSHTITITGSFTVTAGGGDPAYTCDDALAISAGFGGGHSVTGSDGVRLLDATGASGSLSFTGFTVSGFGGAVGRGGAVYAPDASSVSVGFMSFSNNSSTAGAGDTAAGGAIYVESGSLSLNLSSFTDNFVEGENAWGGAVATWTGNIDGAVMGVSGNSVEGDNALGGAVFTYSGTVGLTNFTISNNTATGALDARGGAIHASASSGGLTLSTGTFADNTAENTGAGVATGGAIYFANGAADIDAVNFLRNEATAVDYASGGAVNLAAGGGTFDDVEFSENSATAADARGGAVDFSDTVTFADVAAVDNAALGTDFGAGGAFATWDGDMRVNYSTIASNEVTGGDSADGGGLWNVFGPIWVDTSTFTDNSVTASVDAVGGAIANWEGDVNLLSSTLAGNSAGLGAQVYVDDATLHTGLSVFANPLGGGTNCDAFTLDSDGYNFSTDGTCHTSTAAGDAVGADAGLDELGTYGYDVSVLRPSLYGSPLIDAIPSAGCDDFDQRGVSRDAGGACDIGAAELEQTTFETVPVDGAAGTITAVIYGVDRMGDGPDWTPTSGFPVTPPAGVAFPFGMVAFELDMPADGMSVVVELTFPSPVTDYWKLHDGVWSELPLLDVSGTTIAFELTDGGAGDDDGTANGTIVDPGAGGISATFTG